MANMILHIPHSSKLIPAGLRTTFLLTDSELDEELLVMTDAFTDELFTCSAANIVYIVFPVSRLVVDPERFVDETREPMSQRGMGAIYTKTSRGAPLRAHLGKADREYLLNEYYHPHHKSLEEAVRDQLREKGVCLIVDCHSFSSKPLPHEPDQSPERPDICIGSDSYHTPIRLERTTKEFFDTVGYSVGINRPFQGTIVPLAYYGKTGNVMSIMVEVNRSLYLDESTGERSGGFPRVTNDLDRLLSILGQTDLMTLL